MSKHKCVICGKKSKLKKIKLPHGVIYICYNRKCEEQITLRIITCYMGRSLQGFESEDLIGIANDLSEALGDYFWEEYREALTTAVEWWREAKERKLIENALQKDLPLFINIKYRNNKEILEKRLKGES